jgi:hypothetical protein
MNMSGKRIHRKIERTPEEQRQLDEIRVRFQRARPGLEDLLASGDVTDVVSQGEYLDLRAMLAELKRHRQRQGLSLADVAERSGRPFRLTAAAAAENKRSSVTGHLQPAGRQQLAVYGSAVLVQRDPDFSHSGQVRKGPVPGTNVRAADDHTAAGFKYHRPAAGVRPVPDNAR